MSKSPVNTKHDVQSYETIGNSDERNYKREIYDLNALYDAYLKSKKGSQWKSQVQLFGAYYLLKLTEISHELRDYEYKFKPTSNFILNERGKTRYITGEQIYDRVVNHSACDEWINPSIAKYLIYDNGASIKGKGISFTRERLLTHLRRYYRKHGSNEGYILLIDFSKYYDNIQHDVLIRLFSKYVKDDHTMWIFKQALSNARIDVSYMSDEEYQNAMKGVFNSLEYSSTIDNSLKTGEKFLNKHLDIGNQFSQSGGVAYRIIPDNFAKIVKGLENYAGYMDDSYAIHESKEFLQQFLKEYIEVCRLIGITVNSKKTRIVKLSSNWRFLQMQYSLTKTGRIIKKINPKRLTAMRRKMKKLVYKLSDKEFEDFYKAWFKNYYKYMSKRQRENLDNLFYELRRKKKCTLLH